MYDERFVSPMRQELTQLGVEEMRTAQEVDAKLKDAPGTTLVVVNSVCGCAARNARPAVAKAIQHENRPLKLTTPATGASTAHIAARCPPAECPATTMRDGSAPCAFAFARSHVTDRRACATISSSGTAGASP